MVLTGPHVRWLRQARLKVITSALPKRMMPPCPAEASHYRQRAADA